MKQKLVEMSAQVDKSTPGSRASLSLSQGKGKAQVAEEGRSTPKSEASADIGKAKTATELKKSKEVPNEHLKQKAENSKSAKEKGSSEDIKVDEKKKVKVGKKIEKQENGSKDVKEVSTANGHESKNEKITKNVPQKEKKLKEAKEPKAKKDDKKEEAKDGNSVAEGKANDVNDTIPEDVVMAEEKEPELKKRIKKAAENPKKNENKAKEASAHSPSTGLRRKTSMSAEEIPSSQSPTTLKSATNDADQIAEQEEMETLIVVDDDPEPNEGPMETSTPGKILKPTFSPPPTYQIIAEYSEKEKTESPKERQCETLKTPWEPPKVVTEYRFISGRRSLRSPRDCSFQSAYRESYRRINTELDYSYSSVNATMGSEPANESSFSFFGRGRKRDRTSAVDVSPKTPKRMRLNVSGFLERIVSPVTSLRTKLMGTTLESSTPNGKTTAAPMKIDTEEGVENVSIIPTEESTSDEVVKEDIVDASIEEVAEGKEAVEENKETIEENNEIIPTDDKVGLDMEQPEDMKKPETAAEAIATAHNTKRCSLM